MGRALEQSRIVETRYGVVSGGKGDGYEGVWIGYSVDNMRYYFYVMLADPEKLVFQAFKPAVDPDKHDGATGRLVKEYGEWRWEDALDLSANEGEFFELGKEEQIAQLVEFLRSSREYATGIE